MTAISATLVKELRDQTGAGMMDAKRALVETSGDLEAARQLLRERGMAQAAKRAGRETSEGIVLVTISGHVGSIVAVGCETEPVAGTDEFLAFAERVLEAVEQDGPEAVAELEEERQALSGRLGENIVVRGQARMEAAERESLAEYVHPPANRRGALVRIRGENPVAARRLAMQIVSSAPAWVRREDVPPDVVERERQTFLNSDELVGKPEQARERIVDGMLNKRFFAAYPGGVLLEQPWIHETSLTVAQALEQEGIDVLAFERFALDE